MPVVVLVRAAQGEDLSGLGLPAHARWYAAEPWPGPHGRTVALSDLSGTTTAVPAVRRELVAHPNSDLVLITADPAVLRALAEDLATGPVAEALADLGSPGAITIAIPRTPPAQVVPLWALALMTGLVLVGELFAYNAVHRSGLVAAAAALVGLGLLPWRRTRAWGWGVIAAAGLGLASVVVGMDRVVPE